MIGTCECERSISMSLIRADKGRWERQVCDHLGDDYLMIGSNNMSAIHVMVCIHRYLWKYCWDATTAQVATGLCNRVGNKGGTQVGFNIGNTSILCVNAHLAAHQNKMNERTKHFERILADSPMKKASASTGVHEEYDRVFFMGDLNARVDAPRADVDAWLAGGELKQLLDRDQLLRLLSAPTYPGCPAGLWSMFDEAAIAFVPTYKFDKHSDRYDTSKKQRVPSWTDRILWRRDQHIRAVSYDAITTITCSDHRPVFAQFEVGVDLSDWHGPPARHHRQSTVCATQ